MCFKCSYQLHTEDPLLLTDSLPLSCLDTETARLASWGLESILSTQLFLWRAETPVWLWGSEVVMSLTERDTLGPLAWPLLSFSLYLGSSKGGIGVLWILVFSVMSKADLPQMLRNPFNWFTCVFLKKKQNTTKNTQNHSCGALADVAQMVGALSYTLKGGRFDLRSGNIPGLRVWSLLSFFPFFSPKKSIKNFF